MWRTTRLRRRLDPPADVDEIRQQYSLFDLSCELVPYGLAVPVWNSHGIFLLQML
jgi:hypothetical protein